MLFVIKHINKFWTRGQRRITLKFSTKKNRKFQDIGFWFSILENIKKYFKVLVFWSCILKKKRKFYLLKNLNYLRCLLSYYIFWKDPKTFMCWFSIFSYILKNSKNFHIIEKFICYAKHFLIFQHNYLMMQQIFFN